jgi:hypothetical protein
MHPGNRYPQVAKAATAAPALAHSLTITADHLVACGTTRANSFALSLSVESPVNWISWTPQKVQLMLLKPVFFNYQPGKKQQIFWGELKQQI